MTIHSFIFCSVLPEETDHVLQAEKTLSPTTEICYGYKKEKRKQVIQSWQKKYPTQVSVKKDSVPAHLKVLE